MVKRTGPVFEKGIVQAYLNIGPWQKAIPVVTNESLSVKWRRRTGLVGGGNRLINEPFADTRSVTEDAAMVLSLYGFYVTMDTELLDEPDGAAAQAEQVQAQSEGLSRQVCNDFINGDEGTNPKGFSGMKVLISNLPARQRIAANLLFDTPANRKSNAFELLRILQTGVMRIQQGTGMKPDLMLVEDELLPFLADGFRQNQGIWTTQKDGDRVVDTLFGIPVEPAGFDLNQNPIIGANHDGDGRTSVYMFKWGPQYVHYVQKYGLRTGKPVLLDDQVTSRIKVDWALAPRIKNDFAAVRITGIDMT